MTDRPNDAHNQPSPVANTSTPILHLVLRDVHDPLVVADLAARAEVGRQRYGTLLQAHNGRDALRDSYEEALDAIMYTRQAVEEEADKLERLVLFEIHASAITLAGRLRHHIERRTARARMNAPCDHPAERQIDGPRIPLRWGSAATKMCTACGAWRDVRHPGTAWFDGRSFAAALDPGDDE